MIPVEAVEAAAKVLYADRMSNHSGDNAPQIIDACEAVVKKILEAAAPHMFAQTLRDAVQAFPLETIHAPDNAVVWMMRRAEELRKDAK